MRSYTYALVLLVAILGLPGTMSSQTLQEQLTGSWTFDFQASLNSTSQRSKTHYNAMDPSRKTRVSNIYNNRKLTFNSDGTCIQELADGRTSQVTWNLTTDNKLRITAPNGRSILFMIRALDASALLLEQVNTMGGNTNILFTNWHLTKN